jgi:hypothetical protein
MSQSEQADVERNEYAGRAGQSIEEERSVVPELGTDQDAEPPTPDGEEPDTRQLDPDVAEPASHPDPDPDAL